jgi:hypothetical protein
MEVHDFAYLGLLPVAPYMERTVAALEHTPNQTEPLLSKLSKLGGEINPSTTSLQEFEEFTLPLASSLTLSPTLIPQTLLHSKQIQGKTPLARAH